MRKIFIDLDLFEGVVGEHIKYRKEHVFSDVVRYGLQHHTSNLGDAIRNIKQGRITSIADDKHGLRAYKTLDSLITIENHTRRYPVWYVNYSVTHDVHASEFDVGEIDIAHLERLHDIMLDAYSQHFAS